MALPAGGQIDEMMVIKWWLDWYVGAWVCGRTGGWMSRWFDRLSVSGWMEGRDGGRKGEKEGGREGEREEGGRVGGRKGGRQGRKKRGRKEGKEGGKEGKRKGWIRGGSRGWTRFRCPALPPLDARRVPSCENLIHDVSLPCACADLWRWLVWTYQIKTNTCTSHVWHENEHAGDKNNTPILTNGFLVSHACIEPSCCYTEKSNKQLYWRLYKTIIPSWKYTRFEVERKVNCEHNMNGKRIVYSMRNKVEMKWLQLKRSEKQTKWKNRLL